jgi:hypothetical protein
MSGPLLETWVLTEICLVQEFLPLGPATHAISISTL